jgi:hypothetical protein
MNSKVRPQLILRPICWKIVPRGTREQIIPSILNVLRNRFYSGNGELVKSMDLMTHDWWNIPRIVFTLFNLHNRNYRSRIVDRDQLPKDSGRMVSVETNNWRRNQDRNDILLVPLILRVIH